MKKILLVDDADFARKLIRGLLDSDSFLIMETNNGKEAIELISKEKPDVVLLDLNMPKMTGLEVLNILNEKGLNKNVIILTADIQKTSREKCLELGARAVINKPPKGDELMDKINELIQGERVE